MQNAFWRLKHYRIRSDDCTDPREDHATECLAACLVFSRVILDQFVRFLWPPGNPIPQHKELCVTGQKKIEGGDILDLVLQEEGRLTIVVEVKVESPERGDQLEKYAAWLKRQKGAKLLVSLVQNPNPEFRPEVHGADGRYTWRQWYRLLEAKAQEALAATDGNLVNQFCAYLEREGIVMQYKIGDLKAFGAGIRAVNAMTAVFGQVKQELQKEPGLEFESFPGVRKDRDRDLWPLLQMGRATWERKFGSGFLKRVAIWFMVPPIGNANEHGFRGEIYIWDSGAESAWDTVKAKLPSWHRLLKHWEIYWNDEMEKPTTGVGPEKLARLRGFGSRSENLSVASC